MSWFRSFLISAVVALSFAGGIAVAQDSTPAPSPTPKPAATGSDGVPDIESLREIGSTASLIPATPTPGPLTTLPGNGGHPNGRQGNGGGGGMLGGGHHRGNRANDLTAGQADADPLEVRVAYRRAKTEALRLDPTLADLSQKAATLDSEEQKRALLKEYYKRLFASVRKIDPSPAMKAHVNLLAQVASQRYNPQRRAVGGEEELVNGQGNNRRGRAR